jgi:hypothetical protein
MWGATLQNRELDRQKQKRGNQRKSSQWFPQHDENEMEHNFFKFHFLSFQTFLDKIIPSH